jgi:outer membrane biosynthesis protein TonB
MQADQDRADRLAQLQANARIGDRNQEATDPNATGSENLGSSNGDPADPELARWKARIVAYFHGPFAPIQNSPGLKAKVRVTFDPDSGMIRSTRVLEGSGNASFDAAAERSAMSLLRLELPPERFRSIVGSNLDITYEP